MTTHTDYVGRELDYQDRVRDFLDETEWRQSKRGNLWRNYGGKTVTVFYMEDIEVFRWCVNEGTDRTSFSDDSFSNEDAAKVAVAEFVVE